MLLAIDIGNTNIVVALFEDNPDPEANARIIHEWRISTDPKRTGDEYFSIVRMLMMNSAVSQSSISQSVISSVVPALIGPFVKVVNNITGSKPLIVSPEIYDRLPLNIPATAVHEIGSDLLCNAVESWFRYKKPCITVDFGTALTFTAIDGDAQIQGVAIAPGIGTAVRSLFMNTAQIPSVPLEEPPSALGTNTIQAVQAGIVLGYKGLVESLVSRMKSDLSSKTGCPKEEIKVVATGGLNSVLKSLTNCFDETDKEFTLCGLRRVCLLASPHR